MRLIQMVLSIVLVGAVVLWVYAAAHGFHGDYSFSTTRAAKPTGPGIPGSLVIWLAPVVVVIDLLFVRAIRRHRYVGRRSRATW